MDVAIFQLLPNRASSFCWTGCLEFDGFYQVWDASKIIFLVAFTGEILNSNGDSRIRLLLYNHAIH